MSIEKMPVFSEFPNEDPKLSKLIKWIRDKIYRPIVYRLNWLLSLINSGFVEIPADGAQPGDDGNWRWRIDGTTGDLILQRKVAGTWTNTGLRTTTAGLMRMINTVGWDHTDLTITADGGITPVRSSQHVVGDGGPIDITADPQIAAGTDGQMLLIEGTSDTDTVQIDNGDGVHLHGGKAVVGLKDAIWFHYDEDNSEWIEITRNFAIFHRAWAFASPSGGGATFFIGGHYDFNSGNSTFVVAQTLGTAGKSEAAHAFIVADGAPSSDSVIRVSGISINDSGTRTPGDTEDITVLDTGGVNSYYETGKKWLGQVTITFISGDNTVNYNWGFAKYWDRNNTSFRILGFETTWLAGANDASIDIKIYHHKATGWTYNVGSTPTPPTPISQLTTDHSTDDQTVNGENGAWKRDNLNEAVDGGDSEGTLIEITTTAARTFTIGNIEFIVRPD